MAKSPGWLSRISTRRSSVARIIASTSEEYTCRSVAFPDSSASSLVCGWISTTTEEAVSRCTATIQPSSCVKINAGWPANSPVAGSFGSLSPPSAAGPCSHWEMAACTPSASGRNPSSSPQRDCSGASVEGCWWERTAPTMAKTMPIAPTTAATINKITGTDNIRFPYLRAVLSTNGTVFLPCFGAFSRVRQRF